MSKGGKSSLQPSTSQQSPSIIRNMNAHEDQVRLYICISCFKFHLTMYFVVCRHTCNIFVRLVYSMNVRLSKLRIYLVI